MCGPTLTSPNTNAMITATKTVQKHRLNFSTTVTQVIVLSIGDYTQKEKADCWWTPSDHTAFRKGAKENMKEARNFQRHLITKMEESYNMAQLLGRSHDEKDFDDLLQDPRHLYPKLETWAARTGCRGLERCISALQGQARRSEGLEIREMVLEMDHMCVSDIEIAEAYTDQVRTHTLYARMIGEADYRAAYIV
jgi:hypothetical protein